jgi:non-heme chloroperoxidase
VNTITSSKIKVSRENSTDIELYYQDLGSGKPVILIHAWVSSGRSWEKQTLALLKAGYRVITYDRRGFGASSQPSSGYDYDTLAADLDKIISTLDLHDVALVGYSMGGGEVARYVGAYGSAKVSKAVFISAIPPFLLETPDNPAGIDRSVFEGIQQGIAADRLAFLSTFLSTNIYNANVLKGKLVSNEVLQDSWTVAAGASPIATWQCVSAWLTDFRKDLARFDIPTLIIHGDSDRTLPLSVSGQATHALIKGSKLVVVRNGPHGLPWTHADEVNSALISFLAS